MFLIIKSGNLFLNPSFLIIAKLNIDSIKIETNKINDINLKEFFLFLVGFSIKKKVKIDNEKISRPIKNLINKLPSMIPVILANAKIG